MTTGSEQFPALLALPAVQHGFTLRVPGLEVAVEREEALRRLETAHAQVRRELGLAKRAFLTTTQVHGDAVLRVTAEGALQVREADGLITDDPRVCLGIYVADCSAVYIVDAERGAIGLVHSGRRGSELGIAGRAVQKMTEEFGCMPSRMVVQLSPCIRPPHYEVDFAAEIVASCRAAGVEQVHDCGTCTACEPERYYSYRREMGRTGRMLALLALGD